MNMDSHEGKMSTIGDNGPITGDAKNLPSTSISSLNAAPVIDGIDNGAEGDSAGEIVNEIQASHGGRFAYFKTREFYLVLVLGYGMTEIPPSVPKKSSIIC